MKEDKLLVFTAVIAYFGIWTLNQLDFHFRDVLEVVLVTVWAFWALMRIIQNITGSKL